MVFTFFDLHFNLDNDAEVNIVISDVLGKIVLAATISTRSISVENLKPGIYFVTFKTQSGAVAKAKFIKE